MSAVEANPPAAAPSGGVQLMGRAVPPYLFTVLPGNESGLFREALLRRSCWKDLSEVPAPPKTKPPLKPNLWIGTNGQKIDWEGLGRGGSSIASRQLVNRLPHNVEICRKSNLALNLKKAEDLRGAPFPFLCRTLVLSAKTSRAKDWAALKAAMAEEAARGQRVWIVKPGAMNRGNGIEVMDSFEALRAFIEDKPLGSLWVVQKYIEDPLLVDGRKFDIRAYVLVEPLCGRVLMCEDCYVRTSSTAYALTDLKDRSLHLTNDAVQSKTDQYGQHEDANKLTMQALQAKVGAGYDVRGRIVPRMREIAADTFAAVGPLLNPQAFRYCYELFGLDFMVDAAGAVYLIEINTSPALLRHGQLLSDLIPDVVEEVVQKCIDPVFPGPVASPPRTLERFTPLVPAVRVGGGGRPTVTRAASNVSPSRSRPALKIQAPSSFRVLEPPTEGSSKEQQGLNFSPSRRPVKAK